jgi:two-component system, response regulator PdtaR
MVFSLKTVLIAEDELLVRAVAAEILTDAGFEVIEADHAEGALETLKSRAADIALLFTDINMPGRLDGLELARHVHEIWPDIALLITSGKQSPAMTQMPDGSRFLAKPYGSDQVMAQVETLLVG